MPISRRICFLLLFVLVGCSSLPDEIVHSNQAASTVVDTRLTQLNDSYWQLNIEAGDSAVVLQNSGWDALAQRLALIDAAQSHIDIQYYIWNSDQSGIYLANRLLAAADRGVKVRIMLDDINLDERESLLIAFNSHPNVEIRVFNPIPTRTGVAKWLNVLGDFSRLNRRMHNKSFTVDDTFSVVGGRNIGDEYFDLSEHLNFRDRDVLVMGDVVRDILSGYNQYWDSTWSYPVDLLGKSQEVDLTFLYEASAPRYHGYPPLPLGETQATQFLTDLTREMTVVDAEYVIDNPVPDDVREDDQPKRTARYLTELANQSTQEILLESAYLVFDDGQLDGWQALSEGGVRIRALTNSMAANDLVTNHSAYAGRRQDMLEHGIQLFELMPDAPVCLQSTQDELKCAPNVGYGLHSKSAVFDNNIAAIGSFNFNLRSTYLNSESLLIIHNPEVASALAADINDAMSEDNSWRLELKEGAVYWYAKDKSSNTEPDTGHWHRFQSMFLQLLPIEKYL